MGMRLVQATVALITILRPRYFVVENPRGRLRSLDLIPVEWARSTVWQCHLGKEVAKPTDLWSNLPPETFAGLQCHNDRGHSEGCCCKDHRAAPRGSVTGTQGMDGIVAAAIPFALSKGVLRAVERLEAMRNDKEGYAA
jgi:hypothetical protein